VLRVHGSRNHRPGDRKRKEEDGSAPAQPLRAAKANLTAVGIHDLLRKPQPYPGSSAPGCRVRAKQGTLEGLWDAMTIICNRNVDVIPDLSYAHVHFGTLGR
jgi:hypothetical protein